MFPEAGWRRMAEWLRSACRRGALAKTLEAARPDVLHVQHGHVAWLALPVIRRLGLPVVVSLRGRDVSLLSQVAGPRLPELWEVPSRFLTRCHSMARELRDMGFPERRVFVQPTGVVLSQIRFHERSTPGRRARIVLLSVGRLVARKGMADTISAFAATKVARRKACLRIVGEGPMEHVLKRLAQKLGVQSRVHFTGRKTYEEVLDEMAAADVFVLASHTTSDGDREGIPNVIKEAAASGLPVVSTRHGGIPEAVIHDASGLLAQEGDVGRLSAYLDEIVQHPDRWPEMGRRGHRIIEQHHDIEKLTVRLVEHYQAAIAEGGSASSRIGVAK